MKFLAKNNFSVAGLINTLPMPAVYILFYKTYQ